jgi:pimeloyl-ACP methyl ester carboxylesterase
MQRRRLLQLMSSGIVGFVPGLRDAEIQARDPISYAVAGSGPTLLAFESDRRIVEDRGLTDRYRVVMIDYPPPALLEAQEPAIVQSFTPDRMCADVLSVADALGAERFAFYGYSYGAVNGLQIAIRTNRLAALACGGWPPLGAPYEDMPNVPGIRPITKNFYEHLRHWPEREAVARISCPRLVFAGRDDVITTSGVTARIGPLVAERREELERLGWRVRLVDGYRHELGFSRDVVVPILREFFDAVSVRW